jgi:hypothetical protein
MVAGSKGTRRPITGRFEGRHLVVEYACDEKYCTLFFGPKHDPVLRHTAVINVETQEFQDLVRDAYELFQRLLQEVENQKQKEDKQ